MSCVFAQAEQKAGVRPLSIPAEEMADQQLLSDQDRIQNANIVTSTSSATSVGVAGAPAYSQNDINKLKNCSNGDVNGLNSINRKIGSKVMHEFTTNPNDLLGATGGGAEPPDGGARAWCVMISAFFCNSIIFGIINTCGTVYVKLYDYLKESGDPEASSKAGKFHNVIKLLAQRPFWLFIDRIIVNETAFVFQ